MAVAVFVIFVAYMLCCIADGPDVKPVIKKRLGKYLEVQANRLYPIQYVHPIVRTARESRIENAMRFNEYDVMDMMRRRNCSSDEAIRLITKEASKSLAKSFAETLLTNGFIKFDTQRDFTGAFYVRASLHATKYPDQ